MASRYLDSRSSCTAARRTFGSGLRRLRITSSNRACCADTADAPQRTTAAQNRTRKCKVMENDRGSSIILRHLVPASTIGVRPPDREDLAQVTPGVRPLDLDDLLRST